jgi:hypothetical protein
MRDLGGEGSELRRRFLLAQRVDGKGVGIGGLIHDGSPAFVAELRDIPPPLAGRGIADE